MPRAHSRIQFLFLGLFLLISLPSPAHPSLQRVLVGTFALSLWDNHQSMPKADSFEKKIILDATDQSVAFHPIDDGGYWLGSHLKVGQKHDWLLMRYSQADEQIESYRVGSQKDIHLHDLALTHDDHIATLGHVHQPNNTLPLLALLIPSSNQTIGHTFSHTHPIEIKHLVRIAEERYFMVGSLLNTSSGNDLLMTEGVKTIEKRAI